MVTKNYSVIALLIFLLYSYLILVELLHYQMLPQVTYTFDGIRGYERVDVINYMKVNFHFHTLRVALMLPIYIISDITDIALNKVFGIVVVMCMYFSCVMVARIGVECTFSGLFVLAIFFTLVVFMNGRIAFAIFGNTLILYALFRRHYLDKDSLFVFLCFIALGLLLCNVSSGTTFVAIGFILCFYVIWLLLYFPKINKKIILSLVGVLTLIFFTLRESLMIYFYKNLAYYDDSIYAMLSHGVGKYLTPHFFILLPLLFVVAVMAIRYFKKYTLFILPCSLMASSMLVGLFGLSSLISGLSGFVLLPLLLYAKKNHTQQSHS